MLPACVPRPRNDKFSLYIAASPLVSKRKEFGVRIYGTSALEWRAILRKLFKALLFR